MRSSVWHRYHEPLASTGTTRRFEREIESRIRSEPSVRRSASHTGPDITSRIDVRRRNRTMSGCNVDSTSSLTNSAVIAELVAAVTGGRALDS